MAVDTGGNLFFAERGDRIREVVQTTGRIMTRVAGNGTAVTAATAVPPPVPNHSIPTGMAVDTSGNLYIIDGNRIRKVTTTDGIITTVAGNGVPGYSGDRGAGHQCATR